MTARPFVEIFCESAVTGAMLSRPLIGVLVNKRFLLKPKGLLFAVKLMQANEIPQCYIYFFSPGDIDWRKKKIRATILNQYGQRMQHMLPFPDILYDRGAAFSPSEQASAEIARRRFQVIGTVQSINSCKLDKWQVHQRLARCQAAVKHLPVATLYRSRNDLAMMLMHHNYVFLKSAGGSGGRAVISIEQLEDHYCINYYLRGGHRKETAAGFEELITALSGIASLDQGKWVIQQGIRLMNYQGRLFDLRILLVKNRDGQWVAVYNQARIANNGTVITNLSLGGEVADYHDLFNTLKAHYPHVPSDGEIRAECIKIAGCIEQQFGPFGEIGMDIGVDQAGRIWFLEGNSKPSKLPEDTIEDTEGVSPQFLMILEYAGLLYHVNVASRQ